MLAALCLAAVAAPARGTPAPLMLDMILGGWDKLTRTYVTPNKTREGVVINQVDYEGIRKDPIWDAMIANISAFPECGCDGPSCVPGTCWIPLNGGNIYNWSKGGWHQYYSWWMNMYNVFAVKTMLENSCAQDVFGSCGDEIKSITDAGHLWSPVWGKPVLPAWDATSLDDIEFALRGQPIPPVYSPGSPINGQPGHQEDPRLHACIVCASVSCPNLRNEAFNWTDAGALNDQMNDQFYLFLNNDGKGLAASYQNVTVGNATEEHIASIHLTPILSWFEDDFLHGCFDYTNETSNLGNQSCHFRTGLDWVHGCFPCNTSQQKEAYPRYCRAWEALDKTCQGAEHCTCVDAGDKNCSASPAFFDYDWDKNGDLVCEHPAGRPCLGDAGLIVIIIVFVVIIFTLALFGCVHLYRVKGGWAAIKAKFGKGVPLPDDSKNLMDVQDGHPPSGADLSLKASAKATLKLWLLTMLVVLIVVFIIFRTVVLAQLCSVLGWINEPAHKVIGMVLIAVIYCVATVLLIPGSVLTIAAGFLFGMWGIIPVWVGASAGLLLAWLIGRNLLPHESLHQWTKKYKKVEAVIKAVEEKGLLITLLLRLTPVMPFNALNYVLALPNIKFWHYAVASCAGILPGSLMYVYFGSAGGLLCAAAGSGGGSTCAKSESNLAVTLITWVGSGVLIIAIAVAIGIIAKRAIAKHLDEDEDGASNEVTSVVPTKVVGADGMVW